MKNDRCLCVVIPCYNEASVLPVTAPMFLQKLEEMIGDKKISEQSRILFVNDGSKDQTWDIICRLCEKNSHYLGISQSRNRGHQNAVLAGLMEAKEFAGVTVSIDCDGQDDIGVMSDMMDAYLDGCDIVYGVRSNRETDSFLKRASAQTFYKLLSAMGVETVYNHADYRLLSSRVLRELARFEEVNLFLRGQIPLIGFKSTSVYYERKERLAGESKYPFRKMIGLAIDGITSLSIKPVRMISMLGFFISLLSFAGVLWSVGAHLMGATVTGWASTVCIVCFMSGIQLVSLGVIGEYIGKIYMETKRRPRYIISERTWEQKESDREESFPSKTI